MKKSVLSAPHRPLRETLSLFNFVFMKPISLFIFLLLTSFMPGDKKYTMLCLGDSYTIGESVAENERFPEQTVSLLKDEGIEFEKPVIIARTGWTTDELAEAIKADARTKTQDTRQSKFDFVTLLIGVNNEYRGRDLEEYRKEFRDLLETAIQYASGKTDHVFVLSIPDWGATPFIEKDSHGRTRQQVAKEIDQFNAINKDEALKAKVNYIDITPISREAVAKPELVTGDGLHPSGKMYREWAERLAEGVKKVVKN